MLLPISEILGWGGFKTAIQDAISAGTPIASVVQRNAPMTKKAIQKSLDDFAKLP